VNPNDNPVMLLLNKIIKIVPASFFEISSEFLQISNDAIVMTIISGDSKRGDNSTDFRQNRSPILPFLKTIL